MRWFLPLLPGALIDRLGWTLLHFVWQGAMVVILFAVLLFLMRHRSASSRYLVCCAALVVSALCPPLTFWAITPHLPDAVITSARTPTESIRVQEPKASEGVSTQTRNAVLT